MLCNDGTDTANNINLDTTRVQTRQTKKKLICRYG